MRTDGIHHVGVATRDLDEYLAFFDDVFGAAVTMRADGHAFIDLGGATLLHVFERPDAVEAADARPFAHGPFDHVALRAADRDAFLAAREALARRDASDGELIDFGALVSLFFRTPDGLLHELTLDKADATELPVTARAPRGPAGSGR